MIILGIETSCDETSLALVNDRRDVLAMTTWSQIAEHRPYGGVVPEIAARAHLDKIAPLLAETFRAAHVTPTAINAVAATAGPGLIGGLIVGAVLGKSLSLALNKPFVAVNHLAAHALSVRLSHENITFPYLMLLVSGGHCQLVAVRGVQDYILYGETLDDSAGEVFDKGARLLGLAQPGGPSIEQAAKNGKAEMFPLPVPMQGTNNCDFSFSGLKTALKNKLQNKITNHNEFAVGDAAASLQQSIALSLKEKSAIAMERFKKDFPQKTPYHFCLVGGVAANQSIRQQLTMTAAKHEFTMVAPPPALCTDNGAMIAWAGVEMMQGGLTHDLNFKVQPRWPLVSLSSVSLSSTSLPSASLPSAITN